MRSLKAPFALLVIAMAATSVARAEPLLIRNSYVVPVSNWEPFIVAKKDLAKHWGKSYVMEAVRYQGTPPMITAMANGELEIANLAYSTLGIAIENAGIGRSARDHRRVQRRRSWLFQQPVLCPQGLRHQENRRSQRQGARHKCDRCRRRHRHEGRVEKARADR